MSNRIQRELTLLVEGGLRTALVPAVRAGQNCQAVIYYDVPTGGATKGLPKTTDVVVPEPSGYPANAIDLAGLPSGSPFLGRVEGAINAHGIMTADGREWCLVSYHPYAGGGAPPWDPMAHGFHTYLGEVIAWLDQIK